MTPIPSIENFAILLGLSLFFGLAFEEVNAKGGHWRPGGIRTFPLLSLLGGIVAAAPLGTAFTYQGRLASGCTRSQRLARLRD